uniref:Uncharacterized protein n=1 Tax=Alexandrium monilatum TaxID=311494 RepID=A0A7S4Q199_9DINO
MPPLPPQPPPALPQLGAPSAAGAGAAALAHGLQCGGESPEEMLLRMLCRGAGMAGVQLDAVRLRQAMQTDPSVQLILSAIRSKEGDLARLREGLESTKTGQAVAHGQRSLVGGARCLRVAGAPRVQRLKARGLRLGDGLLAHAPAREKAAELLVGAWQVVDGRLAQVSGQDLAACLAPGPAKLLGLYSQHVRKLLGCLEALDLGSLQMSVPLGASGAVVSEQLEQRLAESLQASGADPRLAGADLLERLRGARPGAPAWESALLECMNGEALAGGALRAVERGEALLRGLDRVQSSGLLRGVLDHIEGADLEGKLLEGIASFDTGAFLGDLSRALDSWPARELLLNRLLDCCLEGLLDVLPAMRIPELRGEHRRVAYKVLDLDMSGVRFRKEDVHLTLPGLPGTSAAAAASPPPPPQGCEQAVPLGDWSPSDLLRLEARGISAEFRHLRCALRPPLLPEVCVTTDARAAGITLRVGFARGLVAGSRGESRPGLRVSRLQVTMESLQISLDKSSYSRLFNPLIGYFSDLLKGYVCGCLEERLAGPAGELCAGLGALLAEAEPILFTLGKASAVAAEHMPQSEKFHAKG